MGHFKQQWTDHVFCLKKRWLVIIQMGAVRSGGTPEAADGRQGIAIGRALRSELRKSVACYLLFCFSPITSSFPHGILLSAVVAWVASLVTAWYFLRQWFAPDACLHLGGSFDCMNWECSYSERHAYIDVSAFDLPSFWVFITCTVIAVVVTIVLVNCNTRAT